MGASLFAPLGLVACTINQEESADSPVAVENYWHTFVGKPIVDLASVLDPLFMTEQIKLRIVQDKSPMVDREPVYDDFEDFFSREWTIVSLCADAANLDEVSAIEVAVVPTDTITPEIRKDLDVIFAEGVTCNDGRDFRSSDK